MQKHHSQANQVWVTDNRGYVKSSFTEVFLLDQMKKFPSFFPSLSNFNHLPTVYSNDYR